jgi:hypothetical protein
MSKKPVQNLFDLRPRQRRSFEELDDGTIEVLIPRYGNNAVSRLLKKVLSNRPVRVHLDDIGASVWRLCDGQRTVHEIGQSLHGQFGDRIEPVYDRLERFLKQMKQAGLIELEN